MLTLVSTGLIDVVPTGHLSHEVSLAGASLLCLGFALVFVWALVLILRHRRDARAADSIDSPSATFVPGATVVAGHVELDDGVPFAARVEIKQLGKEKRSAKGAVSHEWRETERQTFVHPFWIRHASGERVLVRPTKDIRLVDDLDRAVHDETTTRYLIAELSGEETVVAEGVLRQERIGKPTGQGYRDGVELTWTLTPGPEGRLHLSAEKFGQKHLRKASAILKVLALGWLPCAIVTAFLLYPFFLRTLTGTQVDATVTDLRHTTSRDSEQRIQHQYRVHYSIGERSDRDFIRDVDYGRLSVGDHVPLIRVDGYDDVLGKYATLYFLWLLLPAILLALVAIYIGGTNRAEWYDAKVVETGSGLLPSPVPSTETVLSRE